MKVEASRQWRRLGQRRKIMIAAACGPFLLVVVISVAIVWAMPGNPVLPGTNRTTVTTSIAPSVRLALPPPDLLQPISPEAALKQNAERPFSERPDTPAAAFRLEADKASSERALQCLSQAVYYEAATEGGPGQRAVAQIIINRMRHPAYPASICGVVYQGSERATGCQFTFTCDGSLARMPVASLWKQARRIATEALAGKVFGPVGHATHYHADYVLPYWADSLDKSVQIGRHIFYRLKGGLGAKQTFNKRYAGREPTPPSPTSVEVSLEAIKSVDPGLALILNTGLQVEVGELAKSNEPSSQVLADSAAGKLLLDGEVARQNGSSAAPKTQPQNCSDGGSSGRLKPMTANDHRAGPTTGC